MQLLAVLNWNWIPPSSTTTSGSAAIRRWLRTSEAGPNRRRRSLSWSRGSPWSAWPRISVRSRDHRDPRPAQGCDRVVARRCTRRV